MFPPRAWLLLALSLSVHAQDLAPESVLPPVDLITPVPPPEIPFADIGNTSPTLPPNVEIEFSGGATFSPDSGGYINGPIKLKGDGGLEVFANRAKYDPLCETILLEGNVRAYHNGIVQHGQHAVYHYKTKQLDTSELRGSIDIALIKSGDFQAYQTPDKGTVYRGHDVALTLHDVEHPDYWLQADKASIYPGDRIVFHDLRVIAGDRNILWLPYLSQPLDKQLGYHFVPGARSTWGPFLLNTYGIMLGGHSDPATGEREGDWIKALWHADIRTNKGLGLGADLIDTRVPDVREMPGLSLYHTYDFNPNDTRSGTPRAPTSSNRYKLSLKHRWQPADASWENWRLDTNLTHLSDPYYLEDFERSTYRTNPYPDNTIGIFRRDDASLFSAYTRLRLNDFYRSDTRLPEIAYDRARQPIFGSPILHEGTTSLGFLGEKAADTTSDTVLKPLTALTSTSPGVPALLGKLGGYERALATQMLALPLGDPTRKALEARLLDSSYFRFHTYQELSTPFNLGDFLTLTPRIGAGYSYYGDVSGPVDHFDKIHSHIGIESATRFSRDYGTLQNEKWGINGMLHIVQPYVNWSVVASDDVFLGQPGVDRLTPTTRPQPLDPIRFTAKDDLANWNIVRLGARNHLLTQRDGQTFEWLSTNSYIDVFLDDPEGMRTFSNLYNDIQWQPVPWIRVNANTQFPILDNGSGFTEFAAGIEVVPNDRFEYRLNYRWLSGHPYLTDSSHLDLRTYTRLNEQWGLGTFHTIEFDDGTLEYQEYSLHRDFGSWIGAIGLSSRDNRYQKEYSVVFSLSLKDFPALSLPFELSN